MSIPAIRPTNITPLKPAATTGISRAKTIINFSLAQLSRLSVSQVKIGPLTCREWESHLQSCFSLYWRESHHIREYFPKGLSDFLSAQTKRPPSGATVEAQMRYGVQTEFASGLLRQIEEETGHDFMTLGLPASAFMTLRSLPEKIRLRQAAHEPFLDLIVEANRSLKNVSEDLDCKLAVFG